MKKSIIILAAIALAATSAQAKSPKRGVSENSFQLASQLNVIEPGVTWYYNWGNAPSNGYQSQVINWEGDIEFVPMCWSNYNATTIRDYCNAHPSVKYLLGFNEPNFTAQANLTPSEAAERWTDVKALADELGLELVAPALNYSPNPPYTDPTRWMDEFVALVGLDAFDYVAVHNYGGLGVMQTLAGNFHSKYGKPVWVTEFCYWPDESGYVAPTAQMASMIETVQWLEKTDWIYRYAWFKAVGSSDSSSAPNYGLYKPATGSGDRELSQQGWTYVYLPDFDTSVYQPLATEISACDFITCNNILMDQGNYALCPKPVEISQFISSAYVDYNFDVPATGEYCFTIKVTGEGEPTRFDPKLGLFAVNADGTEGDKLCDAVQFSLPNDYTTYIEKEFLVNLQAGKQTIRLKDTNPYAPSNIHISTVKLDTTNGVGSIAADNVYDPDALIDVYTIDGRLVRQQVVANRATLDLPAGLYIAGSRKIAVR
ncbi:MAG: glycoside hydrolase family protein [Bacteroidales bacterium]|nr:glycoside hydrolase family protein [Bacteroidales bacterium]